MRGLGTAADAAYTSGSPLALGSTNVINVYRINYGVQSDREGSGDTELATAIDMTGSRVIDVANVDHQQAVFQILGFSWRDVVGGIPFLRRYLPDYRPDWQVVHFGDSTPTPFLNAVKVGQTKGISPVDGTTKLPYKAWSVRGIQDEQDVTNTRDASAYKRIHIPIQYDYLPYDLFGDSNIAIVSFADSSNVGGTGISNLPYAGAAATGYVEFFDGSTMGRHISLQRKPAAEYLSVPPTVFSRETGSAFLKWSESTITTPKTRVGTPFTGNVGFIIGNIDFKYTWHQVPFDALPSKTINGCIGRVNLRPVSLPGGQTTTALPGQLLLIAVDTPLTGSPYGNRLWNVEYTFRYNPRGHNNFYDFVAGDFFQASKDGKYYGYNNGGGFYFTGRGGVTTLGDPPDGKLLYDSRDFRRLFCPE